MSPTPIFASLAIHWYGDHLSLLDQRALPQEISWLRLDHSEQVATAITDMVVRGAPAIGITAAYGVALAARQLGENANGDTLKPAFDCLCASRPTAVNLFWAMQRCQQLCEQNAGLTGQPLAEALADEAVRIHREDIQANQAMGAHGQQLLTRLIPGPDKLRLFTHCNTGALATGGHGTALGIIRSLWESRKLERVYAGETRPWLQGSRLTAWELQQDKIPVTLVTDSCAASLMQQNKIDAVIVGADRISANGDTANKIGTYSLAVLAQAHQIPFIVAAPTSTIDPGCPNGDEITIEQRNPDEVAMIQGTRIAPPAIDIFNPAFDITPAGLIHAIVTEKGVISMPDQAGIQQHLSGTR